MTDAPDARENAAPSDKGMRLVLFRELEAGPPNALVEHAGLSAAWMAEHLLQLPEFQQLKALARYGQFEVDNDGVETNYETDDWRAASPAVREWLLS